MHVCVCGLGQTDVATPLCVASEEGHVAVVEALVKAKAALNQAKVYDCIPSCAAGRVRCARMSLAVWRNVHVGVSVAWIGADGWCNPAVHRQPGRPRCGGGGAGEG